MKRQPEFKGAARSKSERAIKPAPGNRVSSRERFPIVGVGASAGGLNAFMQLLKNLPVNTGMGFVLVQHLDPEHESSLKQILSRVTKMPVVEAANNLRVKPDSIYVIPPTKHLSIEQGILKLRPRPKTRGSVHTIDLFFEALAQDQQECAIGVILSGTASDGTMGLEAIKAEGGITFAQDDSAEHDSMPSNARAAGCVDFVMSPAAMAKELARIAKHSSVSKVARALSGKEAQGVKDGMNKILALLRHDYGVDFSFYKPNTIERRIQRRMLLKRLDTHDEYAKALGLSQKEREELYSDLLINVTSFFRNPDTFEMLRRKIFPLYLKRSRDQPIRVWIVGCSTGQEAYSIAMAYLEVAEHVFGAAEMQIFATDLNDANLEKARAGFYSNSVMQNVSPERLRRFFIEEPGGYRINKRLRQMCVFARQNIASDPPFSRMDLISCRNVMIYLEGDLQKKVLPLFHYALKSDGHLLLGQSESISWHTDLFEPVDKKGKIFSKLPVPTPSFRMQFGHTYNPPQERPPAARVEEPGQRPETNIQREADRLTLSRFAPPGVVVNARFDIVQFRGNTNAFLQPPSGKASLNLFKMVREGLIQPLREALNRVKEKNETVRREKVQVRQNGHVRAVTIEVIPLKTLKELSYLVLFEELAATPSPTTAAVGGRSRRATAAPVAPREEASRIGELEKELLEIREQARIYQEEQEATHEELQATTEELQSGYEELQSINEELQTSQEELESNNEELTTLNEEMANRNSEWNRLYNDLANLHATLNVAIILLGRDVTVRRFTPLAEKIFNLRSSDISNPLSRIRHNLDCTDLETFIMKVIDTVRESEREVQDKEGRWYSLRVHPYLTLDKRIDGAVLMLVDIDALKRGQQEIAQARDYAEAVLQSTRYPLLVLSGELRVLTANAAFHKMFNTSATEVEGRRFSELGDRQWSLPKLQGLLADVLRANKPFDDFEVVYEFPEVEERVLLLNGRPLEKKAGETDKILLAIDDITDSKQMQAVRLSEIRYRRLFEAAKDGVLVLDFTTLKIADANPYMSELLGYSYEEFLGKRLVEIGLFSNHTAYEAAMKELGQKGVFRDMNLVGRTKAGKILELEMVSNVYQEEGRQVIQCNIRDITGRKSLEQELFVTSQRLQALMDALPVGVSFSYDATCARISGNPAVLAQFGANPADNLSASARDGNAIGRKIHFSIDGRPITDADLPLQKAVATNAQVPPMELEVVMPDGRKWIAAASGAPIRNGQGEVIGGVAVTLDVTERKLLEERLITARDEAERANRAKDDFLATLSHELRTPLNPILLLASDASNKQDLPSGVRADFESIRKNVELEARLIDDLLDITRIKNGKLSLDMHSVDVAAVLKDALTTVEAEGKLKNIRLNFQADKGDHKVTGDPVRLQQVFWNILKNAVKFTPEGGEVEVQIRSLAKAKKLEVSVTDKGIGMTEEEMSRVFHAFSQGDHAGPGGSSRFGGLGLGLSISRMLVELHAGKITVTSAGRNQGCKFVIQLPLEQTGENIPIKEAGKARESGRSVKGDSTGRKLRLLLVEDHEPTRNALVRLLVNRHYEVRAAASLAEGRELAAQGGIDLLISDISLPDGTGYELMSELRERYGIKGIAMTGYGTDTDIARSRTAGFQMHLTKPVRVESLEKALASVKVG